MFVNGSCLPWPRRAFRVSRFVWHLEFRVSRFAFSFGTWSLAEKGNVSRFVWHLEFRVSRFARFFWHLEFRAFRFAFRFEFSAPCTIAPTPPARNGPARDSDRHVRVQSGQRRSDRVKSPVINSTF